jgi:hypothetical protein
VFRRRNGERVRIGGDLVVREDERVDEDAVAVFGSVTVNGEVAGDVVAVGGGVRLGPRAVVHGEVTSVGGRIDADPEARILGGRNEVAFTWPSDWDGVVLGPDVRVRLWPDAHWWATAAFVGTSVRLGLLALLGLIAALLGSAIYRRTGEQVAATPWQATLVGVGAQLVLGPALALLCIALLVSIIGIPLLALVPLLLLVGGAVWLMAVAAVLARIGRRLAGGAVSAPVAFLAGFALIAVPVWLVRMAWWTGSLGTGTAVVLIALGALIEGLVWSAALGALVLTWLRRAEPQATVVPPPLAPAGPESLPL